MRKLICCLMLLVTLIFAIPTHAEGAPVLPDPAPSVRGLGELLREAVDMNGISCDVYGYSFYRGDISFSFVLMAYEWKVTGQKFEWEKLSQEYTDDRLSVSEWYAISQAGLTAYLNLTGNLLGKACTITLYVPEGMSFTLETELENATPFYNDVFIDTNTTWTGSSSTDETPVLCGYCHGGKTCPECHGSKRFRNPYTGTYLDCSCGNGKCPVCDGEGVW